MRQGVRLALDWGQARIGVASCDRDGTLAFPVTTVTAGDRAVAEVAHLVAEYGPIEVIFGLPRNLAGEEGPAAQAIQEHATALAHVIDVPVRLVDERLTTVTASRALQRAGRNTRKQRSVIDQAAAVEILEGALARERTTGSAPGRVLSVDG